MAHGKCFAEESVIGKIENARDVSQIDQLCTQEFNRMVFFHRTNKIIKQ
jgi:hypothetical protein